ncbi:hypothetical protein [Magnetospirillum sp. UT-4]|uniref:hypothetical protein n=1 Tax=Magnetospirillum sp. UT-4 TaxID=2681467 RepID=UPI001385E347|nr:hypothetical protein [Magnetospirillum sp. UT-4]CAA7625528.1 hypothetical protein MTBUT4_70029 [Magnetospirillum sp. UT-4]
MSIRVLDTRETYRLITDGAGHFAVVEVRCNHVYSLCGHARAGAPDSEQGMAEVAAASGWSSEAAARRCFDAAVRGEEYFKQMLW